MTSLTIHRELDAPFARIWEIFDDFGETHRSHPMVERSTIVSGPARGLNAERRCDLYGGAHYARERITQYAPGRAMTISVVESSFPIKHMDVTIRAKEARAGRTAVKLDIAFTPKMGPLGVIMGPLMMKPNFAKMMNKWLSGVEDHAKTGRMILRFIDEAFPQSSTLQPRDVRDRARMAQWMNAAEAYLRPDAWFGIFAQKALFPKFGMPTDEALVAASIEKTRTHLGAVEQALASGALAGNGKLTLADLLAAVMLSPMAALEEGRRLLAPNKRVSAWLRHLSDRPSFQATEQPA